MYVSESGYNTTGGNVPDIIKEYLAVIPRTSISLLYIWLIGLHYCIMATVKRTAIAGGYFIELGNKDIEIYSIAPDGSGALKRVDDVQGTIRELTEQAGLERDYNQSFRQHVARLIQHINNEESKTK